MSKLPPPIPKRTRYQGRGRGNNNVLVLKKGRGRGRGIGRGKNVSNYKYKGNSNNYHYYQEKARLYQTEIHHCYQTEEEGWLKLEEDHHFLGVVVYIDHTILDKTLCE
ncbi:hypothetical protein M0813_01960 [Anaeramoeba flamelloides]|uniref:Uncharacterized protein n=1 Tax=Anaeramoeba flamelloides TaxID=1746091 RepID=A0ABQ8YQ36_9EUKA|nr:hypothetical protein M0813_01960 [Anaeramoeba flamelloides]